MKKSQKSKFKNLKHTDNESTLDGVKLSEIFDDDKSKKVLVEQERKEEESFEIKFNPNQDVVIKKKKPLNIVLKCFLWIVIVAVASVGGSIAGDFFIGMLDTYDPSQYSASTLVESEKTVEAWRAKDISSLSATQVFVVAEANLNDCTYYSMTTKGYNGEDKGVVTTLGMAQDLYGYRYRNGTKGYFDYYSTGVATVIKKTEFEFGSNQFYSYEGTFANNTTEWKISPSEKTGLDYRDSAEFEEVVGCNAEKPIDYIVSTKTVLTEKNNGMVGSYYSYTITLDAKKSVVNYVKKMDYMSGFGYPSFSSIELRFEVDENMNFQNIYINESYKVIGMNASGKFMNEVKGKKWK